jgi:hypothetical protein
MNTIARASIVGVVLLVTVGGGAATALYRSPFLTRVNDSRAQDVPFSHTHHVAGLGLDCRYCHTSVEDSSFAGIPPTETCMTCHSQVWNDTPMLEPVRESWATGEPLEWLRIHDVPDFVYFDHSIHVNKGVGCVTCHGDVRDMPLMRKENTLHMAWCLQCHKAPEKFVRPKDKVFDLDYVPEEDQLTMGKRLVEEYDIKVGQLTNCSVCHR